MKAKFVMLLFALALGTASYAQRTYTIDWDADFDCDLPINIQHFGGAYTTSTLSNSSNTAVLDVPPRPLLSALGANFFQPACASSCSSMGYTSLGGGPVPTLEQWDLYFCYCCNGERYDVHVKIVSDQNTDMIYVNATKKNEPCAPDGCS